MIEFLRGFGIFGGIAILMLCLITVLSAALFLTRWLYYRKFKSDKTALMDKCGQYNGPITKDLFTADDNRIALLKMDFPKETNYYQSALAIPLEDRTPFEKWKASDPANTWVPWWMCARVAKSLPESLYVHEYREDQQRTQIKAFDAGFKAGRES